MQRFAAVCFTGALLFAFPAVGQVRSEYRMFWVDTFNTNLSDHSDIQKAVGNARAANANAILAQVRRRGDSWYLQTLEPAPQGLVKPIVAGFDPLQDLITEAHAYGIEVHAFVIVCAVSDNNPTLNPLTNPNHVFNLHGGYDKDKKEIVPGPNNWLTRSLLPASATLTFQGHRIGSPAATTFWIDLGHPDAAQYTLDVLMQLVRNYDIDGLHLDRIRYPELVDSSQSALNSPSIGYNVTNVERFNRYYGLTGDPDRRDDRWKQWRRDQVTNFVRRLYLNVIAIQPQVKLSGSYIAFFDGPVSENGWVTTEPYWRVFQDWRAWTEEGITDIAIPMVYKREHSTSERAQFEHWLEWLRNHQYNRAGVLGIGGFVNSIEGSLRQTRRGLDPSATTGKRTVGVTYFSMANPDVAVTSNPLLSPPANTPKRGIAEFASGLTTGKSVNGLVSYESTTPAIFAETASVPAFAWKTAPSLGHLMGIAQRADGSILDTATVTIRNMATNVTHTTATDGNGFFGGVDLEPGTYHVMAQLGTDVAEVCYATVLAGRVFSGDAVPDKIGPAITNLRTDTLELWPVTQKMTKVKLLYDVADNCPGDVDVEISISSNENDGDGEIDYEVVNDHEVRLRAERSGEGSGRVYTILVKAFDDAGNVSTAATTVTVPHDQRN